MKFNLIEKIAIILMVIINIFYIIYTKEVSISLIVISMSGILSVVFSSKGHIGNYLFGILSTSIYIFISLKAKFYGISILNTFYYLPMMVFGLFSWKKHESSEKNIVSLNKMSNKQKVFFILLIIISVFALGYILKCFGDIAPFTDAFNTALTVIATYLCVKRYKEHWFLWILVNGSASLMWIFGYSAGSENALFMIMINIIYTLYAVYGFINWNKMENSLC